MKHTLRFMTIAALCAMWLGVRMPAARVAHAAGEADAVVQPPCDEAAFDAALATVQAGGGGTITFDCGVATIIFATAKTILTSVTIDGANRITLSGGNARQLFGVDTGDSLTLRRITLTNGYSALDGGAISNYGTLVVENSTIQNSFALASGGAIVSYGPVTITNSTLAGNRAANAGAIYPRFSAATTVIINSNLRNNHATSTTDGWGGAILPWDGADVTIQNSEIVSNTARLGGGIHNRFANSLITLTQVLISGNSAFDGGGIYNSDGTAIISAGTLMFNTASRDGGGIYNIFGTANIRTSTFMSNTASRDGGGLINLSGGAIVSASVFMSNTASRDGGGVFTFADTVIQNATFSGNSAGEDGGGLANESKVTLQNATFSGNSATDGGGIHQYSGTALTLKNVALQLSSRGGNCYVATIGGAIVSSGYNLADDGSCTFPQPSDKNNTDPMLSSLEYHGGPTLTHLPLPGSPLVDGGLCIPDLLTDQRGVARPQGAACDIGAVESRPEDYLLKKTFAPIMVR